jgi:translation initiation factor IF-2
MSKVRIYSLAKDLGVDTQRMLSLLDSMGVEYKSISSTLDEGTVSTIKELLADEGPGAAAPASAAASTGGNGIAAASPSAVAVPAEPAAPEPELPRRPPVVTVMGHVDHGKTSLLDFIRKTKVAEKEAGGITQHVGAFEANTPKGKVVFIDTPGHEAFTSIRARGASVADIAIIVVAADDSLMPQTREAIAHARAAKVPMVVGINKIDLPGVNVDRVKQDLLSENLVPEEYGGDTIVVPISARTGEGVDDLLEYLSLVAEVEDLRADPEGELKGVIIESRVDKQAGVLATVLVQDGSLAVGDFLVVGELYGKVRAMTDSNGARLSEAGPGTAVQVLGFSQTPVAGEIVSGAGDEHAAREVVGSRRETRTDAEDAAERRSRTGLGAAAGLSLEDLLGVPGAAPAEDRDLNIILRADTQGSLEAIQGILARESTDAVKVNVMFAGIGAPTEGDVLLASTANATILGFSVVPPGSVKKLAEQRKLEIKTYRIIYELIDDVKRLVKGNVEPVFEDRYLGRAEVRQVIRVPKAGGNIAAPTCSTAGSPAGPRPASCGGARRSTAARFPACAASRTTCARSHRATSAALTSRTSTPSRRATSSRRPRPSRSLPEERSTPPTFRRAPEIGARRRFDEKCVLASSQRSRRLSPTLWNQERTSLDDHRPYRRAARRATGSRASSGGSRRASSGHATTSPPPPGPPRSPRCGSGAASSRWPTPGPTPTCASSAPPARSSSSWARSSPGTPVRNASSKVSSGI